MRYLGLTSATVAFGSLWVASSPAYAGLAYLAADYFGADFALQNLASVATSASC